MLDRYELIAELASGGMATVYLARLGGLAGFQRLFAIKHLHPYLHGDQQFVQMFLDEARLAAGIHHPHVVPIHEVGASESGYYLVMEYVEGDTLARLLARASSVHDDPVPTGMSIRVMLDTLDGLDAAHGLKDDYGNLLNLVHRDVSPQNILVGVDGIARITDFGVARAANRLNATRAGQLKGKLAYMAPEQARSGHVDRRTDVFAAGIVLWEALTMRRLFRADNDAATLNRVLFEPIPKARDVNTRLPNSIDRVVAQALERDPEARFPSCALFGRALEEAANESGCMMSVREVATFVQSTLGQEIQAQRDKVRAWLARSEPSQAWPVVGAAPSGLSGAHGPPVIVPQQVGEPRRSSPAAFVAIGMAVAGALSVAAVAVVWYSRSAPPVEPPPVLVAAPASEAEPDVRPVPTVSAADTAPAVSASASSEPGPATTPPVGPPPKRTPPAVTKKLPSEKDDLSTNPYR
jgi:eukaryotic-like serine/threonine-protein kinase